MKIGDLLDARNEGNRLALEVGECVAAGESLSDIAVRLGCKKVGELRRWLSEDVEREKAYEAGLNAYVEGEMLAALGRNREVVEIADGCEDVEMVDLAKLRIDGRDKYVKNTMALAERVNAARWGKANVNIGINAGGGSLVAILSSLPQYRADGVGEKILEKINGEKVIPSE